MRAWLHIPFYRIAMKEIGLPDRRRIDVLGYDVKGGTMRLVECKVSLRDLRGVQKQLTPYRKYADLLYVAVPYNLEAHAKVLLPKKVGLLVVKEHAIGLNSGVRYFTTKCARTPRRETITSYVRDRMTARCLTWLLAHYEKSRICRGCGYEVPHGP